ncbi:hypothetical protein D9758_013373 [Tetrapyrgos nigripes]|uniref:Uncharacterized protein n=1 Tax=Tetrapyrgos nigripes TaxID=182062 RepID=A0A8H5CKZ1_9AGAR|nr:hypothetical protein D9758_013373 [Tetrapyrgos nigripes]
MPKYLFVEQDSTQVSSTASQPGSSTFTSPPSSVSPSPSPGSPSTQSGSSHAKARRKTGELKEIEVIVRDMIGSGKHALLPMNVRVQSVGNGHEVKPIEVLRGLRDSFTFFGFCVGYRVYCMALLLDVGNPFGGSGGVYQAFGMVDGPEYELTSDAPKSLSLDDGFRLYVKVEMVGVSSHPNANATLDNDTDVQASGMAPPSDADVAAPGRKRKRLQKDDGEEDQPFFSSLLKEIENREGYAAFKAAKGKAQSHKLQNPDIKEYWAFGVSCVDNLAGMILNDRVVMKKDIHKGLELPSSWFSDARKGLRLIEMYGPNGREESKKVVTELNKVSDTPRGWTALLKFLLKHAEDVNKSYTGMVVNEST